MGCADDILSTTNGPRRRMNAVMKIAALVALTAAASGALGQYRCAVNGKTVFQDEPCRNAARRSDSMPTASGSGPAAQAEPAASLPEQPSDLERQKAYLVAQEKNRRRTAIKEEIAALEEQNLAGQQRRDAELDYLQYRKAHARNNLAGATLEHGLAAEMQAVTSRHAADQAARHERMRHLRQDMDSIK